MWTELIAGSYVALTLFMYVTGGVYAYRYLRNRHALSGAAAMLYLGIALSFLGHGMDQTLWSASNVERAIDGTPSLKMSAWYALNIPWFVILGKFIASSGAFFHLYVAWFGHRQLPVVQTVMSFCVAWGLIVLISAFVLLFIGISTPW